MDNNTNPMSTGAISPRFFMDAVKAAERSSRGWVYLVQRNGTACRLIGSDQPLDSDTDAWTVAADGTMRKAVGF